MIVFYFCFALLTISSLENESGGLISWCFLTHLTLSSTLKSRYCLFDGYCYCSRQCDEQKPWSETTGESHRCAPKPINCANLCQAATARSQRDVCHHSSNSCFWINIYGNVDQTRWDGKRTGKWSSYVLILLNVHEILCCFCVFVHREPNAAPAGGKKKRGLHTQIIICKRETLPHGEKRNSYGNIFSIGQVVIDGSTNSRADAEMHSLPQHYKSWKYDSNIHRTSNCCVAVLII